MPTALSRVGLGSWPSRSLISQANLNRKTHYAGSVRVRIVTDTVSSRDWDAGQTRRLGGPVAAAAALRPPAAVTVII